MIYTNSWQKNPTVFFPHVLSSRTCFYILINHTLLFRRQKPREVISEGFCHSWGAFEMIGYLFWRMATVSFAMVSSSSVGMITTFTLEVGLLTTTSLARTDAFSSSSSSIPMNSMFLHT